MNIVKKPQVVIENDLIFEKAKAASALLPCPMHAGGHTPKRIKPEIPNPHYLSALPWGWSHSMWDGKEAVFYAYYCEHCHCSYFIELPKEKSGV